jgi:hypothetical protein
MRGDRDQIKIKINGEDKQYNETANVVKKEVAAGIASSTNENEDKEFDWVLPERTSGHHFSNSYDEREVNYFPTKRKTNLFKKRKRKIGRRKPTSSFQFKLMVPKAVLISIISAIIVGVGLGMAVLMVFTDKPKTEQTTGDIPTNTPAEEQPGSSLASVDFSVNLHIVQGGVFNSEENAGTAVSNLKEQGYPAIMEKDRVLIGVAENEQIAKEIEVAYKEANIEDAYARPWSFNAENISIPEGLEKEWIVKGEEYLKQLIHLTSQSFAGSVPAESVSQLKNDYESWSKQKQEGQEKFNEGVKESMDHYVTSLGQGIQSLSKASQWEIQQGTLDAYASFTKFASTLSEN